MFMCRNRSFTLQCQMYKIFWCWMTHLRNQLRFGHHWFPPETSLKTSCNLDQITSSKELVGNKHSVLEESLPALPALSLESWGAGQGVFAP